MNKTLKLEDQEYTLISNEHEWRAGAGVAVRLTELFFPSGEIKRTWAVMNPEIEHFRDASPIEAEQLEIALSGGSSVPRVLIDRVMNFISLNARPNRDENLIEASRLFENVSWSQLKELKDNLGKIDIIKALRKDYGVGLFVGMAVANVLMEFEERTSNGS